MKKTILKKKGRINMDKNIMDYFWEFINSYKEIEEAIWESGFIDEKKREYVEILSQLKRYIEDNFYTE